MEYLTFIFLGVAFFIFGSHQFHIRPLLPHLDSLRHGKVAFLAIGICAGLLFPETDATYRALDAVRQGVLNISLIWFGLLLGLEFSLRQLRRAPWPIIWGQIASASLISSFAILSILASGSVLFLHLGLISHLPLATLLCTCFVLSARFPEPTFRWRGKLMPHTPDPTPTLPIHNMVALLLLTFCFPILSPYQSFILGSFSFVGGTHLFALICILGVVSGMCLDFALRAHRNPSTGMAIACCILIFFAGLGNNWKLPALSIGFIAGVWLINTTVAKRSLLEALARVDSGLIPLFYLFVGTLIGGYGGDTFFKWPPLLPLIAMILIVRSMGRTLGYSVSQYLWHVPETWRDTLELSARPLGTLSVAIAVQALFLLELSHNTLIAGLLGAVVISQITLFPPHKQPTKNAVATLQKD
jgi:Kef-type K+ transport system membrane component KefB